MGRLMHAAATFACAALVATTASAYSVLAHESNIDALWDTGIRPLLVRKYPHATSADLQQARAYAYGGSVVQDLGYYPFGSHFFSNLLHYVRSGDFVESLVSGAQDVNEYAFALGALSHYAADNVGHPEAVNRSVPILFPKLRAKFGDRVTYVQSPASHVITEFSFDIVQVAAGGYASDAYHRFIGFQVAKPAMERAFQDVYGLDMRDVLPNEDLAIATYRHAISELIPQITRAAWRDKRDEIAKLTPAVEESGFVYRYNRRQYEQEFGASYRKPSLWMRFVAFLFKLLPKIGPLRPLSFKAPTPDAEAFFTASLKDTRARYGRVLEQVREGRADLPNTDFDTGKPSVYGEYSLSDDTYRELLNRLSDRKFANVPAALRTNINRYYAALNAATLNRKERKRALKIEKMLASLNHGE
jgi:hypothetical protein